jgi:sulfide:quinone oxidoreductase
MERTRVVVLGAGFGGLELTSRLAAGLPDLVDITLIDKADGFVFGFQKLDMMFGKRAPQEILFPYRNIAKAGVRFRQETIVSIDPAQRRTVTDQGTYDADVLVVALGADLDPAATPGLVEGGNEYYSVEGASALRDLLPSFESGAAIVGVCGAPFKCPPAPSEAAILLDEFLKERGRRSAVDITLVIPFGVPIPPSPDTSKALIGVFQERGIRFIPDHRVASLDPARKVASLDDGRELPYDLFLGIPVHKVPPVVESSGLAQDGWIPVDPPTLATKVPDVYALGDVANVGVPKAGVFAEGQAKVVADHLIARIRSEHAPAGYDGSGTCYIEFGDNLVGRVDVNFLAGPGVTGVFAPPSPEITAEKADFAVSRGARWFGA